MPIAFSCPACSAPLSIDDQHAGATVNCPQCNSPMIVPQVAPQIIYVSQPRERNREHTPHPGIAVVLSFFWPGLGHLYCGHFFSGFFWMLFHGAMVFIGMLALLAPPRWGADNEMAQHRAEAAIVALLFFGFAGLSWLTAMFGAYFAARTTRYR